MHETPPKILFPPENLESKEILVIFVRTITFMTRIMATIVLQVPDESLVTKVKQACKMLMGVSSVKVQKTPSKVEDITKTC